MIVNFQDFIPKSEPQPAKNSFMLYLIIIPIILCVALLLFCFYHVWRLRRKNEVIERLTEDEVNEFRNGDPYSQSQALFYPYNTDYEIPKKEVHFGKLRKQLKS